MKIAVIEGPSNFVYGDPFWNRLKEEVSKNSVEILLLNELPFGSWIANEKNFKSRVFDQSCMEHQRAINGFPELLVPNIVGSSPAITSSIRLNRGFVWQTVNNESNYIHDKQFIPSHEGYFEAEWFSAGQTRFNTMQIGNAKCGILICTDTMFNEWARYYGRNGTDLILVPRATSATTIDRWKVALSMAAIVSGCFVASSNRCGQNDKFGAFGGAGMVFSPRGELIVETNSANPICITNIDITRSKESRKDYPCNVPELPGRI